jgi:two-component system, chemotaxis family, response regulator Rcp1
MACNVLIKWRPQSDCNGERVRILLVEDNAGDVFLVRRALEKQGLSHDLTVAPNGEAALQLLDQAANGDPGFAPELVLLDLNLPKVNGTQVLCHIRETAGLAATPVIIITSSDSPSDRERTLSLGANVYFRKPTDLQSFMRLGQVVQEFVTPRSATRG